MFLSFSFSWKYNKHSSLLFKQYIHRHLRKCHFLSTKKGRLQKVGIIFLLLPHSVCANNKCIHVQFLYHDKSKNNFLPCLF